MLKLTNYNTLSQQGRPRGTRQEFGDDHLWPTRAVLQHRPSERTDAEPGDLEFEVAWITSTGIVETFEPVRFLVNNEHFKAYVRDNSLESHVRAQARRERARTGKT